MKRVLQLSIVAAVLLAGPHAVAAQLINKQQYLSTAPTTDQLLTRIVALEARIAQLESMLALVNGQVVLDGKSGPVLIRGGSVTIMPDGALNLRSGASMNIGASMSLLVRASSAMSVEAAAGLDLKGSTISLNGGTKPVACAGSVTTPVAAGAAPHVHVLTPQGCGATVLVP